MSEKEPIASSGGKTRPAEPASGRVATRGGSAKPQQPSQTQQSAKQAQNAQAKAHKTNSPSKRQPASGTIASKAAKTMQEQSKQSQAAASCKNVQKSTGTGGSPSKGMKQLTATPVQKPHQAPSGASAKPEAFTSSSKKEERSSEYDPDEVLYKKFVTGIYIDRVQGMNHRSQSLFNNQPSNQNTSGSRWQQSQLAKTASNERVPNQLQPVQTTNPASGRTRQQATLMSVGYNQKSHDPQQHQVQQQPSPLTGKGPQHSQHPQQMAPHFESHQQVRGFASYEAEIADAHHHHGAPELELLMGRDAQNSIRMNHANGGASGNDPSGGIQGQGAEQIPNTRLDVVRPHQPRMTTSAQGLGGGNERQQQNLSDRYSMQFDGLSFDALFGSHYDSEKDEDYSIKEDLIQNTKTYQNDFKPFKHQVSKAEIAYLKSQQKYDSLLFPGREHEYDFLQNPAEHHYDLAGEVGNDGSLLEPDESRFFEDVIFGTSQRKGTRSQLGGSAMYHQQAVTFASGHGGQHHEPSKRRKFADDEMMLHKSEGANAWQASQQQTMRMTRQQRMYLVSQHRSHNQKSAQDGNQIAQHSSNINILSSNQSQQNLNKQSNGSSLPGGPLLTRHQEMAMAEANPNVHGVGRTPSKDMHSRGKPVQTKSIECQVSPGLLNGDCPRSDDEDKVVGVRGLELSPEKKVRSSTAFDMAPSTIGRKRQEKAMESRELPDNKKRRRRKSKKQKDAEAAAEKAEQQKQIAAAAMALQQQRMQQDQMAYEMYKQQGSMMSAQGYPPPYMLAQKRAASMMHPTGMFPTMGNQAGYHHQATQNPGYYPPPMGSQHLYGMVPPNYGHHMQGYPSPWTAAGAYQTGATPSQPQMHHHTGGPSSTVDHLQSKADSVSGVTQGASNVDCASGNPPQQAVGPSSSKRKKLSHSAKLSKHDQQQKSTSSLLRPQMLFGTNIANNRFYSGQLVGADFNIMDHYGFMMGPHLQTQAAQAYSQHQQLQQAQMDPNNNGLYPGKHTPATGGNAKGRASKKRQEHQYHHQQQQQHQQYEYDHQQAHVFMPELGAFQEERFRSKLRKEFYPFLNHQLKELIQQIDMYIQLLYQVLLFDEAANGNKTSSANAAGQPSVLGKPVCMATNGKKSATLSQLNHAFNSMQHQKTPQHVSLNQGKLTESQKLLQSGSTRLQDTATQNLDNENSASQPIQQRPGNEMLSGTKEQEEMLAKKKAYYLLYQFINKRDQILRSLDLPMYEVPWLRVPQTASTTSQHRDVEEYRKAHREGERDDEGYGEEDGPGSPAANHQLHHNHLINNTSRGKAALAKRRAAFRIQPQVTYLQAPLLEYAPFVTEQIQAKWREEERRNSYKDSLAQELNLGPSSSKAGEGSHQVRQYTYKECFDTMKPLINRYLLPPSMQPKQTPYPMGQIAVQPATSVTTVTGANGEVTTVVNGKASTSVSNNNRRKFSRMDDNMMILGLQEFGQKNMEQIMEHWLPRKTVNEIKHRYKNLTCQRVHENMVKSWKQKQSQPLTEREFYLLCQGIKWFGESTNRWALIAKTFLPGRTVKFIQVEFSSIVTDFEKSNRFGKMLLLDVPDEKLLTLANEIPESASASSSAKPLPPESAEEDPQETRPAAQESRTETVDQTYEIIRKKVQVFEEVDIDRISDFIIPATMQAQEHFSLGGQSQQLVVQAELSDIER